MKPKDTDKEQKGAPHPVKGTLAGIFGGGTSLIGGQVAARPKKDKKKR